MKRRRFWIILCLSAIVSALAVAGWHWYGPVGRVTPPRDVRMIAWEVQDWSSPGGARRLSLWADGRNETTVEPDPAVAATWRALMQPKPGWTWHGSTLVRENPLPRDEAKLKFKGALETGVHLLQAHDPEEAQGLGVVVSIQTGNSTRHIRFAAVGVTDDFGSTRNERRFLRLQRMLDDFDASAYTIDKSRLTVAFLAPLLRDAQVDPEVRRSAARLLGMLGDGAAQEALRMALPGADDLLRVNIENALRAQHDLNTQPQ